MRDLLIKIFVGIFFIGVSVSLGLFALHQWVVNSGVAI